MRDAAGGEIARLADEVGVTTAATWAADGSFLLTSSPGGSHHLASDGWQVVRTLPSVGGRMLPVALSPDGSRIALGWDHHVSLWSAHEAEAPALQP